MFTRILIAAGLSLAFAHGPAAAAELTPDGVEKAGEACTDLNEYGPVETVTTVEDGLGDYLIWVKDKDGDLWMCNANAAGAVFTNVLMEGDLLKGDGAAFLGVERVNDGGIPGYEPYVVAEALCANVGSYIEEMEVVVTVEDGMGDYLTWLKNANDELWVCNASASAKLYSFEPVDAPVNDFEPIELRYA
jgi:hypothetical protein